MANSLDGQTILVTGATDGLGRAVALDLAGRGAKVCVHGRDVAKVAAVVDEIGQLDAAKPSTYIADFASIDAVRDFADQCVAGEARIDVLINNAGLGVERARRESDDGLEMVFQVDYLAGYLLTARLLPLLRASAPARIVNVASLGQAPIDFADVMLERSWSGQQSYCQAKLAQIMMAFDLADELAGDGITITALHPATFMPTKIVRGIFKVRSTLEEGVANVVRLAIEPSLAGVTGRYFDRDRDTCADPQAYDAAARRQLRALTEDLVGAFDR